jgi:hypothetical protein
MHHGSAKDICRGISGEKVENTRTVAAVAYAELAPLRDGAIAVVSVHG